MGMPSFETALITGGGTGLGRVIALHLARVGVRVAITGRTRANLEGVADEARRAGGQIIALPADLTASRAVDALVDETERQLGPLDMLVNNAAVMLIRPVAEISDDQWDWVMKSNLYTAFYCCRALVPRMVGRGRGVIINISATGGKRGSANFGAFAASKFALHALNDSLAKEVKAHGVHVCAFVLDGAIDIPKMHAFLPGGDATRWLDPEEIARAVVYIGDQKPRAWSHELWLRPHLDAWM